MTFADVHHVVAWKHDGVTDLDNLALLCRYHHGVVHKKSWSMTGNANEELTVVGPTGRSWCRAHRHCGPGWRTDRRDGAINAFAQRSSIVPKNAVYSEHGKARIPRSRPDGGNADPGIGIATPIGLVPRQRDEGDEVGEEPRADERARVEHLVEAEDAAARGPAASAHR